jgi:hypothetical protein
MRSRLFATSVGIFSSLVLALPAAAQVAGASSPVLSPPLRAMAISGASATDARRLVTNLPLPVHPLPSGATPPADGVVQQTASATTPVATGVNFDGVGVSNSAPPDTNGAVGKSHFVQWVNTQVAVWDKSGRLLAGPVKGNTLFASLGGTCAAHNDGDPLAEYDQLADRWVLTQFAVGATDGSYSHQCFAVSQTGDPLGAYYLYDFRTSTADDPQLFVDYPHLGIWPDGYYVTTHQFGNAGDSYDGQGLYVYDRARMIAGLPATFQYVLLSSGGGALPSDLDGITPPPPGTPNYVVAFGSPLRDTTVGNVLHVYKVKTTWGSSPKLDVSGPADVAVSPFNDASCEQEIVFNVAASERPCIAQPQPATPEDFLDGILDRLLYRLAYRYFPNGTPSDPTPREVLVMNHTVGATTSQTGVRWYELRDPGGTPALVQQSTWAGPAGDAANRWMGSIAMDQSGNMLLGYSKSSLTLFPEIDLAGRLATDPPSTLGAEILMKASGGAQTGTGNRWGDYSEMSVDPFDGCTFWFTSEYLPASGEFNWKTRVASFRFPSCAAPAQGVISGVVTDCATGQPLSRAIVQVSNGFSGAADANGRYSIIVPPGKYTVTAIAPDRACAASASQSVTVANGGTASASFCLTGAGKLALVSASIDDSSGNGNGTINKNECVKVPVTIRNNGCAKATGIIGVLSTSTPGVTVTAPQASFPDLAVDANAASATPFSIATAPGFVCGTPIVLNLALQSSGGSSTATFTLPSCEAPALHESGAITLSDAVQNVRLGRDSNASVCGSQKTCPSSLGTGNRNFDAYTYTNTASGDACVKVTLTADPSCSGNNQIFSVAYLDAYDPQNLCTNYLADEGSSPDLGYNTYSFTIPSGRTFVVVVDSVSEGGVCPAYNLDVAGLIDDLTSGNGACAAAGNPPVANPDSATTYEGQAASIAVLANDTDGGSGPLSLLSVSAPAHGTAAKNADGTVTYTPAAGFNSYFGGNDSFTYQVKNALGFTATATVTVTVTPICTYVAAPGFADDAESGLAKWTVDTAANPPAGASSVNWTTVADPTAASASNHSFFTSDVLVGPKDDRLVSPVVNLTKTSRVTFSHRYDSEDTYDGGVLEVSTDGGSTWRGVVAAGGVFLSGAYTSTATGVGAAWSGMNPSYPQSDAVVVDVGALAGLNRRFRFRFVADDNTGLEGWHVDDVAITNLVTVGTCTPPTTTTCLEDDASQIEYSTAWHLGTSANASGGHFRYHTGNNPGDLVRLAFQVPSGKTGAVTYAYATSPKGGSAELWLDGVKTQTISYAGPNGSSKDPRFGASVRLGGLAAGTHTLELRAIAGAAYVDGFCLETAGSTSAPSAGPGATSSSSSALTASQTLAAPLSVPSGTKQLTISAEAAGGIPIKLVLLDPSGKLLASSDNSSGFATIEAPISKAGTYTLQLVNLSLGPVSVWTAATPLVAR